MKLKILLLSFACLGSVSAFCQSTAFGVKGGPTVGFQKVNGFDQDALLKWHGIAFVESLEEEAPVAVFAQLGYHLKGSAIRSKNFASSIVIDGITYSRPPSQEFIFQNVSLTLGAKRKRELTDKAMGYVLFGLRGDYTVGTNLDKYEKFNQDPRFVGYYPIEGFVKKLNYGVTLGGGIEFAFAELIGGLLELTVNPDFSPQYKQPAININTTDPYTGQPRIISERITRNLTFEITAGFRFIRKVEYID